MPQLALSFLGGFDATLAGAACTGFESNKVRALLVFLALEPDRAHTRAALAGLLWPEQPEPTARKNLRDALFNLRKVIGNDAADPPFVSVSRGELQFNLESDHTLDAIQFNALLTASSAHPHRRLDGCRACAQRLAEAAALYRGDLLAGLFVKESAAFEDWLYIKREYFREQALQALQVLASFHERRREYAQAIGYARRQLELAPWDEAAHGRLMRNLAANGERAAALEQYARCCQRLAEELGVEPAAETVALYESIRDQGTTERYDGASHSRPFVPKQNLPVQATPFEGRSAELLQIGEQLNHPDCRLLTLVGAGGVGKTRLALKAAADEIHNYQDGVWFVALAGVNAVDFIPSAIADAIGFRFQGPDEPATQLLNYLREKALLLVLDNFEHLVKGATFVGELLAAAPRVQVLATSRERLQLQGERLLAIPGMATPPTGLVAEWETHDATRMFVQSARRLQLDFEPTGEDASAIARVCRLVEGLPLGIELSAALVRYVQPAEIVAQIEHNLTHLSTSLRDVPARHRSLRAVCDQSWQLLEKTEREVLQRLSVFRGGLQREAAEEIAGASLSVLAALVDKSIIRRTPTGRYEIHEMLREYAAEKLAQIQGREASTKTRHSRYYLEQLAEHEAALQGAAQNLTLMELRADRPNINAAWDWAVAQRDVAALELALEGMFTVYDFQGLYREGAAAFGHAAQALTDTGINHPARRLVRGIAIARQGFFCHRSSDHARAEELLQQSLATFRTLGARRETAFALQTLGSAALMQGKYVEADQWLQESRDIYTQIGYPRGLATTLNGLANLYALKREYDAAQELYERSAGILRETDDQRSLANVLGNLGNIAFDRGQYDAAEQLYEEGIAIRRDLGDRWGIALSLITLGNVAHFRGKYAAAEKMQQESLSICREFGHQYLTAFSLTTLGNTALAQGVYEQAETYHQESLRIREDIHDRVGVANSLINLGRLALAQGEHAQAQTRLQAALRICEEISDRLGIAFATSCLGDLACDRGEHDVAKEYFQRSLECAADVRAVFLALGTLVGIADTLAREGVADHAVELLALTQRHTGSNQETRDRAARLLDKLEVDLAAEAFAEAVARGQSQQLEDVIPELLAELTGDHGLVGDTQPEATDD